MNMRSQSKHLETLQRFSTLMARTARLLPSKRCKGKHYELFILLISAFCKHYDVPRWNNNPKCLCTNRFEKRSRNFNYYRYFTADRVVNKADDLILDIIERFKDINQSMYDQTEQVNTTLNYIQESIENLRY